MTGMNSGWIHWKKRTKYYLSRSILEFLLIRIYGTFFYTKIKNIIIILIINNYAYVNLMHFFIFYTIISMYILILKWITSTEIKLFKLII